MSAELLAYLEDFNFPKTSASRARESLTDGSSIPSLTFGIVHKMFTKDVGLSAPCIKYPKLYDLLKEYGRSLNPNFNFGLITLNKNFKCKPHFDKKNQGITMIVGFGDYQNGRLCLDDGRKIDIKDKPFYFNGASTKHWVEDFSGTRYTAVFYTGYYNKPIIREGTTDSKAFQELLQKKEYTKFFGQKRGEIWCDIGANVGAFTYRNQLDGIETHSYEPESENYKVLLQNSVTPHLCHNKAVVCDNRQTTTMYLAKSAWNHTIARPVRGRSSIDVPCISFADATRDCNCVKMDIEGGELEIMDNCDLSNFDKLIIAYHINYDSSRDNLMKRLDKLRQHYYVRTTKFPDTPKLEFFPNEIMIYCIKRKKIAITAK